jgi:hypothetical protein
MTVAVFPGTRIIDMPDLGAVTDTSSFVGERAGSGRFGALALRTYISTALNSVAPEDYGALGDGSTNDTAAINAAIATGKNVRFGAKTYQVTNLNPPTTTGQRLVGAGSGATVIRSGAVSGPVFRLANGSNKVAIIGMTITRSVVPDATGCGIETAHTGANDAVAEILLYDLLITGQQRGLCLGPTDFSMVRDVIVDSCHGDGIYVTNTVGTNSVASMALQWTFDHVLAQFCDGHGIFVEGVAQTMANAPALALGEFRNVSTFANTGGGIWFEGGPNCKIADIRIGSNSFFGADGSHEIYLDTYGVNHSIEAFIELAGTLPTGIGSATPASNAARGILISANNSGVLIHDTVVNGCANEGIYSAAALYGALGAPVSVSGCQITNNGLAGLVGAQSGIMLAAGATAGMIVSGSFIGQWNVAAGTGNQKFGVSIGQDKITISGCRITGNATSALNMLTNVTAANSSIDGVHGDAASVGAYLENVQAVSVSLSTGVTTNVTAFALQPGDWDVRGVVSFAPAATTTVASVNIGINIVTAAFPGPTSGLQTTLAGGLTTGAAQTIPVGPGQITLTAPGTIYLVAQANFGVSTMQAGGRLSVRKMR